MKTPRTLSLIVVLLGLAGAGLFVALMMRQGIPEILAATAAARWGVAVVVAFHGVPLLCDVMGWRALIPGVHRQTFGRLFLFRWIGDSVSAILPVAQVGGEIVRVRLAAAYGMPVTVAGASVLVGITISIATQIVFTLSGLGLLMMVSGHSGVVGPVITASVVSVAVLAIFYAVQRVGMFRMAGRVVAYLTRGDTWRDLAVQGEALDREIRNLYSRRAALATSGAWTLCTWATGAAETWICLRALGVQATYADAYIIESMVQGLRSVMFLVPAALGVQEGGFVGVGVLLGMRPDTLMAPALIRRVRELAFGVPGIIAWQVMEGWFLWKRQPRTAGLGGPASPYNQEPPAGAQAGERS